MQRNRPADPAKPKIIEMDKGHGQRGMHMVQQMTALGLTLCLAGLASLGYGQTAPTVAPKRIDFEGKWDGKYKPSRGAPGEGKYEFGKEKGGRWAITVSWIEGKETKTKTVKGERLGPDALRLEGKYGDTTYWYIGRMEGQRLVLRYLSVNGKTGESGTGVSELTRPK